MFKRKRVESNNSLNKSPEWYIKNKFDFLIDLKLSYKKYQKNGEYEFYFWNSKIKIEIFYMSGIFTNVVDFAIYEGSIDGRCNRGWNITRLPLDNLEFYKDFLNNYNKTKVNEQKILLVANFIESNLNTLIDALYKSNVIPHVETVVLTSRKQK
jgi:hypothetical protein